MSNISVMNDSHLDVAKNIPKAWLLRRCENYYDEYKHCSSFKGKFYQLYVDGKADPSKCQHWEDNFEDCKIWTKSADVEAAKRIIEREDLRVKTRLRGHFANDVWERRDSPPEDWNKPLPKVLAEASENSLLKIYQDNGNKLPDDYEMKHISNKLATSLPQCVIL